MKADLHLHSNISDGSDSIKELAEKINETKLDIVALTDHDSIDGVEELESKLPKNVKFIKGIELTCILKDIKCHILGYYINPKTPELVSLIKKGKELRKQKLEKRIKYLKDEWSIELTESELDWLYSRHSVVKTHIANILVNRGLAENNVLAMKKYLDGCKTGNTRFDGIEAIQVIKKSGGIPVWAHPLGGEGEEHISESLFIQRLRIMQNSGIEGLECYYSRYNESEIKFLVNQAEKNNLLISGGSDYHGSNKDIPLCKLNTLNKPINSEKLSIIN